MLLLRQESTESHDDDSTDYTGLYPTHDNIFLTEETFLRMRQVVKVLLFHSAPPCQTHLTPS
jgi:hypothetical protein